MWLYLDTKPCQQVVLCINIFCIGAVNCSYPLHCGQSFIYEIVTLVIWMHFMHTYVYMHIVLFLCNFPASLYHHIYEWQFNVFIDV